MSRNSASSSHLPATYARRPSAIRSNKPFSVEGAYDSGMANSEFDTAELWVVTCPGKGAPHPAKVPKSPASNDVAVICLGCGLSMSYAKWLDVVEARDSGAP